MIFLLAGAFVFLAVVAVCIGYDVGYHRGWVDASEDDQELRELTSGLGWPD